MERWDDMRIFLTVARAGTLSSAAKALGLGTSTVQRRVLLLEEDVGTLLFQKSPRGYRLTHAGEALLPRAQQVEDAMLAAERTVVGHDQQASGDVRVTAPLVLLSVLGEHLSAFIDAHPQVRPVVLADDVLLDLGRAADVALRATTRPLESAVGQEICPIAWGCYAPVSARSEDLPWLEYSGMASHPAMQWYARTQASARVAMSVDGVSSMNVLLPRVTAQGLLPCFLGDQNPRLRRIGDPVAFNQLWLLIHADLRRSARVRALVDFLVPRLREQRALFAGG